MLKEPEKYEGKVVAGAEGLYSIEKVAAMMSKATGKTIAYKQVPVDVYKSFLPPAMADQLAEMGLWFEDFWVLWA